MKTRIPRISNAEWEVMKQLWDHSPQTAAQICEALCDSNQWQPNTVKTLIGRLVRKGALKARADRREHLYIPAIAEKDCVRSESRSFLGRVYNGATMPMIVGLLEHENLSKQEIAQLRNMLDEMERRHTGGK